MRAILADITDRSVAVRRTGSLEPVVQDRCGAPRDQVGTVMEDAVKILLSGVVGSTAYGLARPGSDLDRLGVFVAPTVEVAGLSWHSKHESHVTSDPDSTLHEVGKYLRLVLKGNPTVTELLWLPDTLVETKDPVYGSGLVALRRAVLSESAIRDAYAGYARQQAHRLRERGDGSFSSETRKRTTKHARHLLRLLRQGRELLTTGELTVRVADPEEYFAFDSMTPEQMLAVYERETAVFAKAESVLPDKPDFAAVQEYLATVRAEFLWGAS